jgi:hypothetical protein
MREGGSVLLALWRTDRGEPTAFLCLTPEGQGSLWAAGTEMDAEELEAQWRGQHRPLPA